MFVDIFLVAILLMVVSVVLMALFEWMDSGVDGMIDQHLARARAKYDKGGENEAFPVDSDGKQQ